MHVKNPPTFKRYVQFKDFIGGGDDHECFSLSLSLLIDS